MKQMKDKQRVALLIKIIKQINAKENKCSEYLLNQVTYIMKMKLKIDFGFEYILDQQGLYSDGLHNCILDMFIEGCIKYINNVIIVDNHEEGKRATDIERDFKSFTDQYDTQVEALVSTIEKLGTELPKLVTAIFMNSMDKKPMEVFKLRINLYRNANESKKYLEEAKSLIIANP